MRHMEDPNALARLFERLEQLNQIGVALSGETDISRLLESILLAAKQITNADGGTLDVPIPFRPIGLFDSNGKPVTTTVVAYAFHHDKAVNIEDAYTEVGFDFSGTRDFDKNTGYRSRSFLTVPMKSHENEVIGVLQLINAKDRTSGAVGTFSIEDQQLAESLASQAAISLTNRLLIDHLQN